MKRPDTEVCPLWVLWSYVDLYQRFGYEWEGKKS